jgi:hypothetical protein
MKMIFVLLFILAADVFASEKICILGDVGTARKVNTQLRKLLSKRSVERF